MLYLYISNDHIGVHEGGGGGGGGGKGEPEISPKQKFAPADFQLFL